MFLPFVIFLLNNLSLGKCSCVAPWCACRRRQLLPTGKRVCWSLLQNGWLCYCTVFCSACISQKSQGDGRGLSGFFVPFTCHCREILFHLPPLITQQLWEKRKEVTEPSKHQAALGSFVSSLACCCTSQSWAKGKQGMPYVQKDPSLTLLAKVTTLWRYLIQTPHQCQLECKIRKDISKPAGAHFLSKGSSKLFLILFLVPQDRDSCLCLPTAIILRMPFVMGAI